MASSKQIALTRPTRGAAHAAQSTRVPAFLNKLYEMVNDEKTNHLIQWSASGDTFLVFDQERFAREVLPHWFKHQNFASFVRQLNMYGFHKIPHLQQGVLKGTTDAEHWNFVHEKFRRDQPDLLHFIQRKKGPPVADELDSGSTIPTNNAQVLDIQSIVGGIAAIKRHQTTISAELSELKRNNELLWQESQAARSRHQKQQDTINRIVKFLAGVFGHHAGSPVHKEDVVGSPPSRAVVPRKQSRLMIEGSMLDPRQVDEAESPAQIATIETPASAASPIEPASPKATTPSLFDSPAPDHSSLPADDSSTTNVISTQPQYPQSPNVDEMSITPSRSPTNPDFDNLIQGALSSLTPAQIQQLMNSISMPSMSDYSGIGSDHTDEPDSSLMSYQPPLDFSQLTAFPLIPSPPPSAGLVDQAEKSWQDTEDIEQDVDAVDSKINNLFQQFQIPNDSSSTTLDDGSSLSNNATSSIPDSSNINALDSELFHSFLNGLDEDEGTAGDDNTSTAFLDEVPSPSDGALSPIDLPEEPQPKSGRKRKSDVQDTATVTNLEGLGTRPKRRRER
ncbi:transcription factor Hsf1 [Mycena alexandri]|uniref:Transcription factor Hsf1 n=1 Tax=Mycena alexandri TaxID=1745969 RepID=A0AAD6TKB2_9AGAR|nr:transcription factor Hsf1 [Mycena alexandri]